MVLNKNLHLFLDNINCTVCIYVDSIYTYNSLPRDQLSKYGIMQVSNKIIHSKVIEIHDLHVYTCNTLFTYSAYQQQSNEYFVYGQAKI